jgi:glycerol-3-phosphate dehydrogenase
MIRAGLFLYDHLTRRELLPASREVDLPSAEEGIPLHGDYLRGFIYADCWADDARLVVMCAKDAAERGADIAVRTACTGLRVENGLWRVEMGAVNVQARCVINAAGPWVRSFLDAQGLAQGHTPQMRLMKGSHIVVPRLHDGDQAYLLQQPDGRIVFVLPYQGHYSLIGTTDIEFKGDPLDAMISAGEIEYLCAAVNRSFKTQIGERDVVSHYSGVRPLIEDGKVSGSKVTRDYKLDLDETHGALLLNVFGGKLTTFRHLSEDVVNKIAPFFPHVGKSWTGRAILPGGDIAGGDFTAFLAEQAERYPDIEANLLYRYARTYGSRMESLLEDGLGAHYGDEVYEAELRYLIEEEWARSLEDILWRRTKLGLHISDTTRIASERRTLELLKEGGYERAVFVGD